MIESLPKNSVLRPAIVQWLTDGVPTQHASQDFNLSERTIRSARAKETNILHLIQSVPGQKRARITEEHVQIGIDFLDEAIPYISGRDYRVCKYTQDKLYALYCDFCVKNNQKTMCRASFVEKCLQKQKIRWVRTLRLANTARILQKSKRYRRI